MSELEELLSLPGRKENRYVKQWKEDGGRVVGLTCSYVPDEIVHAAGLLPYRLEARGCEDTGLADVYMHRFNCTFARSLLQEGLSGGYDFLDGLCFLNGCEQIRRMFEIWDKHVKSTDYLYMVTVPHSLYEAGLEWYTSELHNFKESLMSNFGVNLTVSALSNAIDVYNESRRLLVELYELRKAESVPLTGAEALKIVLSAYLMPRETYNTLLKGALAELRLREGRSDYKARLMLGGSALDDVQLVEMIEALGGVVVTDSLCYGSRHFLGLVEQQGAPLQAVARRYYYHNPCPRMMGEYPARRDFVEKMAREANVDGVIMQSIVFCDPHGVDNNMFAEDLQERGLPVLTLAREHTISDVGRFRTRIEAFMERIARR